MLNRCEACAVASDSVEHPHPSNIIFVGAAFKVSNILYVARPALHCKRINPNSRPSCFMLKVVGAGIIKL